ncbi:hypothetical protein SETIT_3G059100v2 [Setaria italica]|uniref:F-box domain-containing protein n=1 Tax=Setaria italica TaxID=4555 RepID=A0A368QBW2_SETIT|nr:hypothetical protein SETIT_3G059100v2 [Setaria italica]
MAPLTRQRKKALAAAAGPSIAPADRLGALPDDALRRILGFLPAKDVVRTCVLGRHWRHLWKSASGLRIGSAEEPAACGDKLMEFVGSLLQARGGSPLETCELLTPKLNHETNLLNLINPSLVNGYYEPDINRWIRHAVMCHVRVLFLGFSRTLHWFEVVSLPLVSQHLARLVLFMLELNGNFLDFSSCSVLEQLEIDHCRLQSVNRISSQSLKSLSIIGFSVLACSFHTQIRSPNLISLHMECITGRAPVLERMPSLVEAVVDINLSQAKKLVLSANIEMIIFRRDLIWCPIFSNLKTLLLNEYWCVPGDLSALACILEHSPVLEKLTLQLFCEGSKSKVQIKGSPDPAKRSTAISEHLKIVEIKCEVLDQKIQNVLEFLSKLNIRKL